MSIIFSSAQPRKAKIKLHRNVLAGVVAFAPILTNEPISISSDDQRHFDKT